MYLPILAATLVLSPAPQELTLLPDVPDGWRFERLDFPLSFAPGIAGEGFEELAFAPGMFDADSDSYWSYALAIRIEEDLEVDEAYLEGFLGPYYRGLCEAVGAGRDPVPDLSGFKTTVAFDGERYLVTIEMVDAFVTGEPLTLALRFDVHRGPAATELLGIASPSAGDAPVWGELEALRKRWLDARQAPALLNHLYLVPDEETYAACTDSVFLREVFAITETRRTVRRDLTYEGLYFYGRSTYFELLAPDSAGPRLDEGSCGIALGFERTGAGTALAKGLRERKLDTFAMPVTRELEGRQVPWFTMLGFGQGGGGLNLFSLEYDPRFLSSWRAELPPEHTGLARRDVLARYAAVLGREAGVGPPLLRDITAVHVSAPQEDLELLAATFDALDWAIEPLEDGYRLDGPGIRIELARGDGPARITAFEMALTRPIEREPLTLGRATLAFEGAAATLRWNR